MIIMNKKDLLFFRIRSILVTVVTVVCSITRTANAARGSRSSGNNKYSNNNHAMHRLLDKVQSFRHDASTGRRDLKNVAQFHRRRHRRRRMTTHDENYDRQDDRDLKTDKKNGGKHDDDTTSAWLLAEYVPLSCCEFLSTLSRLDARCYQIVREAEIVDISLDPSYNCANDVTGGKRTKKKGGGGAEGTSATNRMSQLANKYEDASWDYNDYLLDAVEGLFDEVGSECFDITPTTFTFACEPEAATVTDAEAFFDGVDVTEFGDFYLIPDDDPTAAPRARTSVPV